MPSLRCSLAILEITKGNNSKAKIICDEILNEPLIYNDKKVLPSALGSLAEMQITTGQFTGAMELLIKAYAHLSSDDYENNFRLSFLLTQCYYTIKNRKKLTVSFNKCMQLIDIPVIPYLQKISVLQYALSLFPTLMSKRKILSIQEKKDAIEYHYYIQHLKLASREELISKLPQINITHRLYITAQGVQDLNVENISAFVKRDKTAKNSIYIYMFNDATAKQSYISLNRLNQELESKGYFIKINKNAFVSYKLMEEQKEIIKKDGEILIGDKKYKVGRAVLKKLKSEL